MARFKKIPLHANEGKITYGDKIVENIVMLAVNEIPHVKLSPSITHAKNPERAINVVFGSDGVHVDVTVKTFYTQSISDMAFKIQESIRHNVEAMTEYHIANVNVSFNDVFFEEETIIENNDETVKEG